MAKWIKNIDSVVHTYQGQDIAAGAYYEIQPQEEIAWSNDSLLLTDIGFGLALAAKDDSGSNDITDVNDAINYLKNLIPQNVTLTQEDTSTGGIRVTNKFAPTGWLQRLHEIEFTSSTVGGAIHDKDYTNTDTGWSSVDFYEDISGTETLMVSPTQNDLDTKCIRTDFKWMPNVDYMILSGVVSQIDIPNDDVFFWGMFLDIDAALQAEPYNISPVEVLGGGMNMKYIGSRDRVGLRGVSGSTVSYSGIYMTDGSFVALSPGMGTNRIRYIFRHPVGLKHRIQSIFEIFRA